MDDGRLDLSTFEMRPEQMERLTAAIMARVAPEMRRRRASRGVLGLVAGWRGPVVAASALLTAISLAAILLAGRPLEAGPLPIADLYDALEIGDPVDRWLAEGRGPSFADLVIVVEDGYAP